MAIECDRREGPAPGPVPSSLHDLTKAGRDFVQAVARGLADGVRLAARKLDGGSREQLTHIGPFRDVLDALHREAQWRPEPGAAFNLYGPLDPTQKQLRAATSGAVRKARVAARRLVANTVVQASPHVDGIHYRTAAAMGAVLKTIPSISEVLLFGSVARGEEKPDSDVDLLVMRASGLGDAGFRDVLFERLRPIAELTDFPILTIRSKPFAGLSQPPAVHLLFARNRPRRWSDRGIVSGELVSLWRMASPRDLVAARGPGIVVQTGQPGAAVLHEQQWHWRGEDGEWDFRAEAIVEVGTGDQLELRIAEVSSPLFPTGVNEFRCWLTAQGKHTTERSEDALLLTYDAITNWVEQRTGRELTIGTFSE